MYIETMRMIIRNFIPEDADDLYAILGDDKTMKKCEPAYDFKKTADFLASFCIEHNGALAAVHKESSKMIGYILFNEFDAGVYEMGWFYNRNYWGQGYAYESCKALINYAFRELSACKIFAETIDTVKSVGLMKKLGMQLEYVQRDRTTNNHDNPADLYTYSILAEEWKQNLDLEI